MSQSLKLLLSSLLNSVIVAGSSTLVALEGQTQVSEVTSVAWLTIGIAALMAFSKDYLAALSQKTEIVQ